MFRNLDAEQARNSYTNQQMEEKLNISRVSYENKKKTGKFTALEAKRLCRIFHVKFDYLFKTEPDGEEKRRVMGMVRPRGTDSAKVIQVIVTESLRGKGTNEDLCRIVTQCWDFEGNLIAENDPCITESVTQGDD
ncbi:hypothetical protein [Mediterraneibacter agrestimuris]|uniref:hypothetical protein n=1 Tax=Mediterraneibacter agrestimuris TaxID=2941333 RepID=UPI00203DD27A|nr:hypothetical protein [Mediterraneibacter agrestimuris]